MRENRKKSFLEASCNKDEKQQASCEEKYHKEQYETKCFLQMFVQERGERRGKAIYNAKGYKETDKTK